MKKNAPTSPATLTAPAAARPLRRRILAGAIAAFLGWAAGAEAGTQYWDANGAAAGFGGTGNWDLTTLDWNDATGTALPMKWDNLAASDAIFQGTPGVLTITVAGVKARNLTFNIGGDTIAGSLAAPLNLQPDAIIDVVNLADTATISAPIVTTTGFDKQGAGTLLLSGANTYTGQTSVTAGTLKAGATTAFAPMSIYFVSGTLNLGGFSNSIGAIVGLSGGVVENNGAAAAVLTLGGNNQDATFQGVIRDGPGGVSALGITKVGTARQTFSGANTYTGDTLLQAGALFSDVDPADPTNAAFGTGKLVISGGTTLGSMLNGEVIPNKIKVLGNFTLAAGQPATNNLILTGAIDLDGGVREISGSTPDGQLKLLGSISNGGVTLTHTGAGGFSSFIYGNNSLADDVANAYTGLTTLNANTFLVLNKHAGAGLDAAVKGDVLVNPNGSVDYFLPDQIADSATVTVNSAGLTIPGSTFAGFEMRDNDDTIGALFGNGTVGLGSAVLTVGRGNFTGVIEQGTIGAALGGQLMKNTAGTLTLGGANTYTGKTTVTGGILDVSGSIASLIINVTGGDFIAGKSGAIPAAAAVTVSTGAGFEYHAVANTSLAVGSLVLNSGAGTTIGGSIGSTPTGAKISVTGNVTPTPGAIKVNVFAVNGVATGAAGIYTLLTGGAGSTLNVGTVYSLGTVYNATNFTVGAPTATATAITVPIVAATALTNAFWVGGLSGSPSVWAASNGSTASNWASDNIGTPTPLVPGAGTAVFFSAGAPATPTDPGSMTLGSSMSIASLTINAGTSPETRAVTLNNTGGSTLTLAGAGGLTINAGAGAVTLNPNLILGASQTWTNNSSNPLTVGGNISNGASDLTVTGSANTTLSGVIGNGSGGLTKSGTGTLTVTNTNTYTGDTFLNAGSLFVDNPIVNGAGQALGLGTLHIAGGTTLGSHVNNTRDPITGASINEVIPNSVQVAGDFTIVTPVDAINPLRDNKRLLFSGNIDLQGGSRTITGTTPFGLIGFFGAVSNGGVTLANTAPTLFTNFQYGRGDGTDVANTYTGLTTVNSGVLLTMQKLLPSGSIDGAIAGDVLVNVGGSILYNESNQIANTSNVTIHGTGLTDSFGNRIAALELQGNIGGNNDTIGGLFGDGTVGLGSGSLTVGAGNFSGVIGDGAKGVGGTLTKNTTGTLTLSGANTYTGNTNINNGTLVLNGSVQSPTVFVNFAGTLMGTGTAAHNVINAGVFSPGNSAGTFHIGGNFLQTGAGTTVIEIGGAGAGEHDLVTVGGQALLDGTLRLVKLGNARLKVGDKVTFLTAQAGVSGQFRTVQNPFATGTIASANVVYGSNDVSLQIRQGSFAALGSLVKLSPNQKSVATEIDHVVSEHAGKKLIAFLNDEPLANLPHDFDLIAAEEFQSVYSIGLSQANVQTANLQRRMDDIRSGRTGFSAEGLSVSIAVRKHLGGVQFFIEEIKGILGRDVHAVARIGEVQGVIGGQVQLPVAVARRALPADRTNQEQTRNKPKQKTKKVGHTRKPVLRRKKQQNAFANAPPGKISTW